MEYVIQFFGGGQYAKLSFHAKYVVCGCSLCDEHRDVCTKWRKTLEDKACLSKSPSLFLICSMGVYFCYIYVPYFRYSALKSIRNNSQVHINSLLDENEPSKNIRETNKTTSHLPLRMNNNVNKNSRQDFPGKTAEEVNVLSEQTRLCSMADIHIKHSIFTTSAKYLQY